MHENEVAKIVLDCAFNVHTELGPGLLESVYETALEWELRGKRVGVDRQRPIPVVYHGVKLEDGFRADLVVENKLIVEVKALEVVPLISYTVMLTYLRFANMRLGLVLNFHEMHLRDGVRRVVNNLRE